MKNSYDTVTHESRLFRTVVLKIPLQVKREAKVLFRAVDFKTIKNTGNENPIPNCRFENNTGTTKMVATVFASEKHFRYRWYAWKEKLFSGKRIKGFSIGIQ